ncbi:hypothetical protein ES703_46334 [subsurface metagenome]
MFYRIVSRILLVVAALAILILSLMSEPPYSMPEIKFFDKLGHFSAYFILGFLVFISFQSRLGLRLFFLAVISSFLYGGLIELLQYFTLRNPELWDLAANFAGSVGGAATGAVLFKAGST